MVSSKLPKQLTKIVKRSVTTTWWGMPCSQQSWSSKSSKVLSCISDRQQRLDGMKMRAALSVRVETGGFEIKIEGGHPVLGDGLPVAVWEHVPWLESIDNALLMPFVLHILPNKRGSRSAWRWGRHRKRCVLWNSLKQWCAQRTAMKLWKRHVKRPWPSMGCAPSSVSASPAHASKSQRKLKGSQSSK